MIRPFLALFIAMVSAKAMAQLTPVCQYSLRSDSFGRGVESGFMGTDTRGRHNDELCFNLGLQAASRALEEESSAVCQRQFKMGQAEGKKVSPYSAGVQCYNLGYLAAMAALGTGAREGNLSLAPASCIRSYNEGMAEARAQKAPTIRSKNLENYCYQLGHFEGPVFDE